MNAWIRCALFAIVAACSVQINTSKARAALLTMDDLPNQPVNGLVHPSGVSFGFTVGGRPSTDARYAAQGPGSLAFVNDPVLEGASAGVLTVTFPEPMAEIQFGVARSLTDIALANGLQVELFDSGNESLGVSTVSMYPVQRFIEARFIHLGAKAVRAVVSFPSPNSAPRFAFDNLLFRVPEPASRGLAVAAAGLSWRRRRRTAVAAWAALR